MKTWLPLGKIRHCTLFYFFIATYLKKELGNIDKIERAKRPAKLPVVFTREEAKDVLAQLKGTNWLMASLLYGSRLRVMKCVCLRVKDLDFNYNQIVVRDGKGNKDRVTMLALSLKDPLTRHLKKVKLWHEEDLHEGFGKVYLPYALEDV